MKQVTFTITLNFEPCEGSGDIVIDNYADLKDYIYTTVQSNIDYDKVKATIIEFKRTGAIKCI